MVRVDFTNFRFALFLTCLAIAFTTSEFSVCAQDQATQDRSLDQLSIDRLGYPDAITTIPQWGDLEFPFDMEAYLGTAAEHHAAKLYFDALFEFDNFMYYVYPELRLQEDQIESNPRAAIRERVDRYHEFLDRIDWDFDNLDSAGFEELESIQDGFQVGLEKLELAQRSESAVFQVDIDALAGHSSAFRGATLVLMGKARLEIHKGNLNEACRLIEMSLRASRDVVRRGDLTTNLVSTACERMCLEMAVPAFLNCPELTPQDCRNLVRILQHHRQQLTGDPLVEADKQIYCFLRNTLFQLHTDAYPFMERAESFDMKGAVLPSSVLLVDLVDMKWFRLNHKMLWARLEKVARENPELAEAMRKLPPGSEIDELIDRMLFQMFAQFEEMNLSAAEYNKEIEVLNQRHRDMVQACSQPFPQKVEQLKLLESAWTTDDSWKSTKLLQMFLPQKIAQVAGAQQRINAWRNGWTCAAALACWNLENESAPESFEAFLKPAGIDEIPLDPYSGSPLKMASIDQEIVIYSVGPDGDDDGGRPQEADKWRSEGDIVFRLNSK